MRYLGNPDAANPPILSGPDGEQVPMRDLTREEGIQYRDVIHANEKATGIRIFEPIHEEPAKAETRKSANAGDKDGE
jgi:hypothetical protein